MYFDIYFNELCGTAKYCWEISLGCCTERKLLWVAPIAVWRRMIFEGAIERFVLSLFAVSKYFSSVYLVI